MARIIKKVRIIIPESKEFTSSGVWNTLTSGTAKEVGTFSASTDGTMFCRRVISDYTKTTDKELRVKFKYKIINTKPMMNDGVQEIRNWFTGNSFTMPTHIAWGNGTDTISVTNTTMENELERNAIVTTSKNEYLVTFESVLAKTEPAAQPVSITRMGLFNNDSAGDMFSHDEYFSFTKTNRLEVQSEFTIFIR